jgi:hypothetical protein
MSVPQRADHDSVIVSGRAIRVGVSISFAPGHRSMGHQSPMFVMAHEPFRSSGIAPRHPCHNLSAQAVSDPR